MGAEEQETKRPEKEGIAGNQDQSDVELSALVEMGTGGIGLSLEEAD